MTSPHAPDQTQPPVAEPRLTDAQREAIVAWVEHYGRSRRKTFGKQFNQADFLAGALIAFYATGTQDKLPAQWVFLPMAGRDVFAEDAPTSTQPTAPERAEKPTTLRDRGVYDVDPPLIHAGGRLTRRLIYCEGELYTPAEWRRASDTDSADDHPSYRYDPEKGIVHGDSGEPVQLHPVPELRDTGETEDL